MIKIIVSQLAESYNVYVVYHWWIGSELLLGYYETKLREQKSCAHCTAALLKNKISLSWWLCLKIGVFLGVANQEENKKQKQKQKPKKQNKYLIMHSWIKEDM